MADALFASARAYRALFFALAAITLFVRILPLSTEPGSVPGPDIVLCLTFAWVLRRPEYVPALLIAAVVLLEDMLTMRPPGLWAAIVVLAAEVLRNRTALMRELAFPLEWAFVAAVIAAAMMAQRLVLALLSVPQVAPGPAAIHLLFTVLAYPLVVGLSQLLLGVRKTAPGEVDDRGRRL